MEDNKEEAPLRVALYLRVSTEEQTEKYGLDAQRAAIQGMIKSRGKLKDGRDALELLGKPYEYVDDISGTTETDERPAFRRLKEDTLNAPDGQKPFDMVAVYKIDRFARKLRILMGVLKFFEDFKIKFISATESIDTSSPFGRAMLGIMGVIAELELETIRERTQRGREQAMIQGVFMGKHPPYGYKKDKEGKLEILEPEAKMVKAIYYMFASDKQSPQIIADILTKDNVLSPDASAVKYKKKKGASQKLNSAYFWRQERIRKILSDEVYIGILYYNKTHKQKPLPKSEWKMSPHRHNYIIPKQFFELVQSRLEQLSERKAITKKKEQGHLYLLSGLLKCDHCKSFGEPKSKEMMSWTGIHKELKDTEGRHSYYYGCNRKNKAKFSVTCPVVPIPAKPLEDYVIGFLGELLKDPKATYEYQQQLKSNELNRLYIQQKKDIRKHLLGLLNALPLMRQRLLEQHKILAIDMSTLERELKELKSKEGEYKEKIDEIDSFLSQSDLSEAYYTSLNLYSQKYGKALNTILDDKKELYDLIHKLIYQIVVYSRPTGKRDRIAGRKKEGQMIPNKIDIHLNLPQNLLQELYTQKFSVKSDNLWRRRESNPRPKILRTTLLQAC